VSEIKVHDKLISCQATDSELPGTSLSCFYLNVLDFS